jgi:DNA-directed RNA polymerase specialized sigma24 family protein
MGADAETLRALHEEGAKLTPKLRAYALRCGVRYGKEMDVVQTALLQIGEGTRRWNHEAFATFSGFALSVVRSLAEHDKRIGPARFERPESDDPYSQPASSTPNPEALQLMREDDEAYAAMMNELAASFPDDEVCRSMVLLAKEGVREPRVIAERLGLSEAVVRAARKRLRYAIDRITSRGRRPEADLRREMELDRAAEEIEAMRDAEVARELAEAEARVGPEIARIQPRRRVALLLAVVALVVGLLLFLVFGGRRAPDLGVARPASSVDASPASGLPR